MTWLGSLVVQETEIPVDTRTPTHTHTVHTPTLTHEPLGNCVGPGADVRDAAFAPVHANRAGTSQLVGRRWELFTNMDRLPVAKTSSAWLAWLVSRNGSVEH